MFWVKIIPIHQVLDVPTDYTRVQQAVDSEDRLALDEIWVKGRHVAG